MKIMAPLIFRFHERILLHSNIFKSTRCYGKNILRRRAVRVLNLPDDPLTTIQNELSSPQMQPLVKKNDGLSEISTKQGNKLIIPPYEKLQKIDPRFTKTLNLIKSRKLREINGKIVLEGNRLINDAIEAGLELKIIYFSREEDLAKIDFKTIENVEIYKVLYKTMQLWSDLTTCPGVMGVFTRPSVEDVHLLSESVLPINILCDNIRDPGNLGSIIRNAAAAGCQNVMLLKGCVDPWELKVLKTGCGGHFRIPIIKNIEWTQLSNYISKESKIFIADNTADIENNNDGPEFINYDESPDDINEDISQKRIAGNENDENSDDEQEIPIKKYAFENEQNQIIEVDETFEDTTELEKFEDVTLPCYLYSNVKYPKDNIVLYVGGETHGVDSRIIKLACEYEGKKLKIPLENEMDSLNSSFALTIILYEIKRQLSEKYITEQFV